MNWTENKLQPINFKELYLLILQAGGLILSNSTYFNGRN